MKRNKRLTVTRETIMQLTTGQLAARGAGWHPKTEVTCYQTCTRPQAQGSLQCSHNELGCSGSGCTEVC